MATFAKCSGDQVSFIGVFITKVALFHRLNAIDFQIKLSRQEN